MRSFANAHALATAMILLPAALLSADVDVSPYLLPDHITCYAFPGLDGTQQNSATAPGAGPM